MFVLVCHGSSDLGNPARVVAAFACRYAGQSLSLAFFLILALPSAAWAQLQILPENTAPMVFAGEARPIAITFRNPSSLSITADLRVRVHQTTSATAVPLYERPWKPLSVLPGQTVLETASLDFPAVRAETRFLVQWLDGTNAVLGRTEVRVFPTNLLARLQTLAGDAPLGVFDPADQLKPLLRKLSVEFQDLAEDGTDKFTGKLAVFGPFASKSQMRASLASDIRALAKRGMAVVWLLPPPALRGPLRPSFHIVRVGDGAVVVAQASLVARLAENPEAQLALLQLAELALHPVSMDLPETETSN
jgi:hypothetical protein